jgi:hypothetical protein
MAGVEEDVATGQAEVGEAKKGRNDPRPGSDWARSIDFFADWLQDVDEDRSGRTDMSADNQPFLHVVVS